MSGPARAERRHCRDRDLDRGHFPANDDQRAPRRGRGMSETSPIAPIRMINVHAEGELGYVVTEGLPEIPGQTIADEAGGAECR